MTADLATGVPFKTPEGCSFIVPEQIGDFHRIVAPGLNGVQGFQADILPFLPLRIRRLIPLRNLRIKVPAVVVNALPLRIEVGPATSPDEKGYSYDCSRLSQRWV